MSRSIRGSKPWGFEYNSNRPDYSMFFGPKVKKLTHKIERTTLLRKVIGQELKMMDEK